MSQRFTDRVVVITGAGGGLGRAFAVSFAKEGAVLVLADVDQALLAETADEVRALGAKATTHKFDLAVEAEIKAFGAEICAAHPAVHVLINNAGLAYGEISGGFEHLSMDKWLRYFAINSVAPLILAQALRPGLAKAKGVVINQSSSAAYMPGTAYGVTKATLNSMTFGMASAFGADGIRVNGIAPGIMETPASNAFLTEEQKTRVAGMQMLKLHGVAQDIADLGLFLASDEARFIDCEIVHCDAGSRLRGWRG
jgi:3-oxoacyl-[acyl-carrier protein] reductase